MSASAFLWSLFFLNFSLPPYVWLQGILIERDTNAAFEPLLGWYLRPEQTDRVLSYFAATVMHYTLENSARKAEASPSLSGASPKAVSDPSRRTKGSK